MEESAIVSRQEEGTSPNRCSSCGKIGHTSSKCYGKDETEDRVNPVVKRKQDNTKNFTCFRCGERGHVARYCRSPQRERESPTPAKREEADREQPSSGRLYSTGCVGKNLRQYIGLDLDVTNENRLYLLLDSGTDVSLLKSKKLIGTVSFEP
jgi:hypothetical protein